MSAATDSKVYLADSCAHTMLFGDAVKKDVGGYYIMVNAAHVAKVQTERGPHSKN